LHKQRYKYKVQTEAWQEKEKKKPNKNISSNPLSTSHTKQHMTGSSACFSMSCYPVIVSCLGSAHINFFFVILYLCSIAMTDFLSIIIINT